MIKRNRNIYRFLIISSFLGVVMLILFGISQMVSYLNSGADRSSMLRLTKDKTKVYLPKVVWNDTINPGRPIEKQTLIDIEKDYLNAWYVKQVAYQTNTTKGIDEYYTTSSREQLYTFVDTNKVKELSIHSTSIAHNLSLDFYSADGQLAVLTDKNVKEYQRVYKKDRQILETQDYSNYQVLLLLEDGFWRIRHMVKEKSEQPQDTITSKPFATTNKGKLYIEGEEYRIKGINYYPQQTPWHMFGDDFDIHTIKEDFDIIKKAGLNTIRIFVQYEDFGKSDVLSEKLEKLQQVLDQAEQKHIKVMVTLFDFYGDYSVLDWTLTHRHAEQIVSRFKSHKAILAWDVKNEPNLDFERRGESNVKAWLKEMIHQIKKYDPNHLVTIGWSDIQSTNILKDEVDIVSFHYYLDIENFATSYDQLKKDIKKPLVMQEFGLPSDRGIWSPFGASQKKQAKYYEQFQAICKNQDIHFLSWTLYDFVDVPSSVVGKLPWRKHKQKHFGFIDKKGNKKEAFQFISN